MATVHLERERAVTPGSLIGNWSVEREDTTTYDVAGNSSDVTAQDARHTTVLVVTVEVDTASMAALSQAHTLALELGCDDTAAVKVTGNKVTFRHTSTDAPVS